MNKSSDFVWILSDMAFLEVKQILCVAVKNLFCPSCCLFCNGCPHAYPKFCEEVMLICFCSFVKYSFWGLNCASSKLIVAFYSYYLVNLKVCMILFYSLLFFMIIVVLDFLWCMCVYSEKRKVFFWLWFRNEMTKLLFCTTGILLRKLAVSLYSVHIKKIMNCNYYFLFLGLHTSHRFSCHWWC